MVMGSQPWHWHGEWCCHSNIYNIIVVVITWKDASQHFSQSPHRATNCCRHACLGGQDAIMCKSCANHVQHIGRSSCAACPEPCGMKGQLTVMFDTVESAFMLALLYWLKWLTVLHVKEPVLAAVDYINPIWTDLPRSLSCVVCAVLKKPQPDGLTVTFSFQSLSCVVCAALKKPQPDWLTVTFSFRSPQWWMQFFYVYKRSKVH